MNRMTMYNLYLSRVAVTLTILCTLSVFLYGIFLLMAVTHTAGRTVAERQMNDLTAHLGDMEMQYLSEQRSLTPERAVALGFVKPVEVSSVYTADTHTLTLNTTR